MESVFPTEISHIFHREICEIEQSEKKNLKIVTLMFIGTKMKCVEVQTLKAQKVIFQSCIQEALHFSKLCVECDLNVSESAELPLQSQWHQMQHRYGTLPQLSAISHKVEVNEKD